MLEDAGYLVYAPTLPYHEPNTKWSPTQGELKIQDYVDYLKTVRPCPLWTQLLVECKDRQLLHAAIIHL